MKNTIAGLGGVLFAFLLAGCGGGGGGGGGGGSSSTPPAQPAAPSPAMQVLPATFDFGKITTGNTPVPLEVTIRNTGTASLRVSSISLTTASSPAFTLSLTTGARPCGSGAVEVAAGGSCTFGVAFRPAGSGTSTSNIQIASNDGAAPVFGLPISGTSEAVSALTVRINQVETSCPNNTATAYVSVTDQGGFPLTGLTTGNFTLTEGLTPSANLLLNATHVDAAYQPLAIAAVVDNSASITAQPVMFADMKKGFEGLFNGLRANDVGELISFGSEYEVTVAFPSPVSTSNPTNKAALVAGLAVPWTKAANTLLYDSVYKAIDDTALQAGYRRAVIVATDGVDEGVSAGDRLSTNTMASVVSYALSKKVPVYTIGIGGSVNASVLDEMARQTGGVYYSASTSQNLATIYQQLTSLLDRNQYALTFNQLAVGAGIGTPLQVRVVSPTGIVGNAASTIVSCN